MGSSNAEKAWRKAIADQVRRNCTIDSETVQKGGDALVYAVCDWIENPPEWSSFEAPSDAEVEVLREQLAAAEAIIEKVRDAWHDDTGWVEFGESVGAILPVAPSEVLEDRDREVAARAVEAARDAIMPPVNWNLNPDGSEQRGTAVVESVYHDVHHELSERAAALRSGTERKDQ